MNETDYTVAAELLAEVRTLREVAESLEAEAKRRRGQLTDAIVEAVEGGVSGAEVARVAGVSRQHVSRLVKRAEPRAHAQKQDAGPVCVNDPATVPTIPDTPEGTLAGVVSLRERRPYGRPTVFMPAAPVADVLAELAATPGWGGTGTWRVYLTGPPPLDPSTGATQAEQVRAWALGPVPAGWSHGEHYLADPRLPVCRYTHGARGDRVSIMRAAMWWGETDADVPTCEAAWAGLGRLLDGVPAFTGAGIADTPATTGRALWLRTIPEGRNYPVLAAELRELIGATSGQGRIELRPYAGPAPKAGQPAQGWGQEFTYLDGRFMYAALTWGMPIGEPARWTGLQLGALTEPEVERYLRGRGRWRITATVPEGWAHVGLLMCPDPAGGWCYPDQPGQRFTTWADGSEVWMAMSHGWPVTIHEGLTWREGKPLNTWRDALVGVWAEANAHAAKGPHEAAYAGLVAKAVRSVLLHGLGAFAAKLHPITRTAPLGSDPDIPEAARPTVRIVGDTLQWEEPAPVSAWTERTQHPEWAATVWARARTRLAGAALQLRPEQVVGLSTDALYVAGGPPGWEDDGRPGAFRVKGQRPGPFTWPATFPELFRLRDEAEEASR